MKYLKKILLFDLDDKHTLIIIIKKFISEVSQLYYELVNKNYIFSISYVILSFIE